MQTMLSDLLSGQRARIGGQTEVRAQQNTSRRVGFLAGNMMVNAKSVVSGVSARVYHKGVYGFASTADYSDGGVKKVLTTAEDNAIFLGSRAPGNPGILPGIINGSRSPVKTPADLPQKQMVDFVKTLDHHISITYKNLISRMVAVNCLDTEKLLLAVDGDNHCMISHALVPRSIVSVGLTVQDSDGAPVEIHKTFGGYGFFADHFTDYNVLLPDIDQLYQYLMDKAEGVYADAGVRQCVLGPDMAGILAHEAVGHTVEADLVMGGSVAGQLMNQQVASEKITLVDFAHTSLGKTCPVPVWVDDEGVEAQDAVLIDRGILRSYMHNRSSAMRFDTAPTGNARANIFSDEPLIRMRNTAILPGQSDLQDMIASVDDGYYIMKTGNGQADTTGEFMFAVTMGYEIKNGKLGRAIRNTTISGVAFEMLKTVDMVSTDMAWSCSGWCGKKQQIPVGMGGPAVRCRVNIGGR